MPAHLISKDMISTMSTLKWLHDSKKSK